MKNNILFILLFVSISCFGQTKNQLRFYSKMPHFSEKGVVWQTDTLAYNKISSEVDLYKSSNYKEYPYLYVYEDNKKEKHYFFIREKDIKFSGKKIEIHIYDESNEDITIFKMFKNGNIFSFKLNY